jgi:hypothetical protein
MKFLCDTFPIGCLVRQYLGMIVSPSTFQIEDMGKGKGAPGQLAKGAIRP